MGVRNDTLQLILQAEQIFSPNQRNPPKKNNDLWEFKLIDTAANKFTTWYLIRTVPTKRYTINTLLTAMETVSNHAQAAMTNHRRRITLFRERITDKCFIYPDK